MRGGEVRSFARVNRQYGRGCALPKGGSRCRFLGVGKRAQGSQSWSSVPGTVDLDPGMFRRAVWAGWWVASAAGCTDPASLESYDAGTEGPGFPRPPDAGVGPVPTGPATGSGGGSPVQADAAPGFPLADAGPELPAGLVLPMDSGPLDVDVGVPDYSTGLGYGPFEAGGEIPIAGLGQAGLTARLVVRVKEAPGVDFKHLFVRVLLVNVRDMAVRPGVREFDVPDAFRCEKGWCYSTSIRVEISHLAPLEELEGSLIRVQVDVRSDVDSGLSSTSYTWGYFAPEQ